MLKPVVSLENVTNIPIFSGATTSLLVKMSRGQEAAMLNSTLACLVKMCQNKRTTVELRNESFVTGRVGLWRLEKGFHLHDSVNVSRSFSRTGS